MAVRLRHTKRAGDLADIAEHAQHSATRKHYIVPSVETSWRGARQRVAHRQAKKSTPRKQHFQQQWLSAGAPEEIRTPDPQIRSLGSVIDFIDDFCKLMSFPLMENQWLTLRMQIGIRLRS
jgi:hypothetical protein